MVRNLPRSGKKGDDQKHQSDRNLNNRKLLGEFLLEYDYKKE